MPQTNLQTGLEAIQQKLKVLLERYSALQKENRKLIAEKEQYTALLASQEEEIKKLTHQNAVLQSGIRAWHPAQKKVFVKRIDAYLKEIEKCIAILHE